MSFIFSLWACVAPGLTTIDEPVNAGKQPEIVEGPYWDECSFNGGDHICDLILPTADGGEEEFMTIMERLWSLMFLQCVRTLSTSRLTS